MRKPTSASAPLRTAARASAGIALAVPIGILAALLLSRAVHFASPSLPRTLDAAIDAWMHFQLLLYMNAAHHGLGLASLAALTVAVAILRPRWALSTDGERRRFRFWLRWLSWVGLVLACVLLDASPYVALGCWVTLPLAIAFTRTQIPAVAGASAGVVVVVLAIRFAPSPVDVACIAAWLAAILGSRGWLRRLAWIDAAAVLVVGLAIAQIAATFGPLLWPGGSGRPLGPGYAYSFCELDAPPRVLALVPACSAELGLDKCTAGHLSEYDLTDFSELARHPLFSPRLFGRALHLLCLDDRIQIGMAQTVVDGRYQREGVIELPLSPSRPAQRELLGGAVGHRMAFDPASNAVFYVSEWSGSIYRWDRDRDVVRTDAGEFLGAAGGGEVSPEQQQSHRDAWWLTSIPMSLQTEIGAVHRGRGTVFFAEWLSGSRVFEVDSRSLALRRVYRAHNGANHSLTVDESLERLIVSGLWGIEVFDLESGELVARRRLGAGPRLPLVDEIHDLVYVPTTYGGGLWVLDRSSYRIVGRIDVGNGGRNGWISRDGRWLFASSARAHYVWDTDVLAARFGRGRKSPRRRP